MHIKLYTNLKGGFAALELMLTDNSCGEKIEVDESECAAEIYQVFMQNIMMCFTRGSIITGLKKTDFYCESSRKRTLA